MGLGISRTNVDSQWNPVYKAFHGIFCCGNETITTKKRDLDKMLLAQQCPLSSSGLRDPAAAICTIPLSLSGELPKYTARILGENEPLHGASFPGTYKVLLPSSLVRETVPVLYASLAGHSHLCALPSRNGARRCGVSKTTGRAQLALYILQTNTMKTP